MKKLFCMLLALLMIAASFAGCSEKANDGGEDEGSASGGNASQVETPAEPEETEEEKITAESTLTVEDFGGRDYRMISTNQDNRQVDIIAEELTGATLNDLVYNRNAKVSDLYKVAMKAEP